jgi:hypothetical protein
LPKRCWMAAFRGNKVTGYARTIHFDWACLAPLSTNICVATLHRKLYKYALAAQCMGYGHEDKRKKLITLASCGKIFYRSQMCMDVPWFPFSENTVVHPFTVKDWSGRSLWRYSLSSCAPNSNHSLTWL